MKTGLKVIGTGLAVALILWGGWFYSHYRITMRMPPDRAAIEVAKRFESTNTAATGKYSARHIDTLKDDSGHEKRVFVVARDGQDVARVSVRPFLRVGWQEQVYERIEPSTASNK
jgi:hypothetical protein